ncbi:hypothetical protein HOY80DRAFT_1026170 [Tuber brumale]|nr:hypothetical protein HOY80DRAFT_1026170 [Tuber brumale]
MEHQLFRSAHSYKRLREDCGFNMEDWTSFHEKVQNVLLQPSGYVALKKPHAHREAWEEWLQNFIDTGVMDDYWSMQSSRKWNVVENRDVIRSFIRDVVLDLGAEISKARNKIARDANYVKNMKRPESSTPVPSRADDPEPNEMRNIKAEAPLEVPGTAEKWPYSSRGLKSEKLEEDPSVANCWAPNAAYPYSLPVPLAVPTLPSLSCPSVKLLPVREVVDIERYDPDAPIELIPEGYVKQFIIDDNGDNRNNIILLKDPTYNNYRPRKRQAIAQHQSPNLLRRNEIAQITSSALTTATPMPRPPWGNRAQGSRAEIPERLPRLMHYSPSPQDALVPGQGKHNWVAKGDDNTSRGKVGIKNEVWSDDNDDQYDEDYRGDDEDDVRYEGRIGTGTDTDGEHGFGRSKSRGNKGRRG